MARSRVAEFGQTRPCAPLILERAEKPLDLAVPARRVGRNAEVAGAKLGERLREEMAGVGLSGMTASSGPQPCARIHLPPRSRTAETLAAFAAACSSV